MKIPHQLVRAGAFLTMAGWLAGGCSHKTTAPAMPPLPTIPVRVQTVETKPLVATEEVTGTVRAKLRARIEAKISGRIEKMLVQQGQAVKAGELLAQLDQREIQARLDQALAQRDQVARDRRRYVALLAQQAVTQQEFDALDARYRVAQAGVTEAETLLSYGKVTAPFDGLIVRKLADVGDLAAPGKALLELENPAAFRFEADVAEGLIDRVEAGARFNVRIPALGRELACSVSEITPAADPASRTFLVKLDLPAVPGLRAGLFGRVAVPVAEQPTLRVPAAAVVQRGQMDIVFVITNRQAQLRLVKTGKRLGDEFELVSGISSGEQVAVEGALELVDGQPVAVRP